MRTIGASRTCIQGLRCQGGQALVLLIGAGVALILSVGALAALGQALLGRGRVQRATDLAAVSAARSMRDDFWRLFEPAKSSHLSKEAYLVRAREAALETLRLNGLQSEPTRPPRIEFPDQRSFAPTRVRVVVPATAKAGRGEVPVRAVAEAEVTGSTGPVDVAQAEGGGYSGPLAYRQGNP